MKRVLHVWPHSVAGGVTEAALQYANALQRAGFEQLVICPSSANYNLSSNIDTIRIPFLGRSGVINHLIVSILTAILAWSKNIDFIFLHNGSYVPFLSRMCRKKLIAVAHGGRLDRYVRADGLISVNKKIEVGLRSAGYTKRIIVLPTPVSAIVKHNCGDSKVPHSFNLGSLGTLDYNKGFDQILHALRILKERGLSPSLFIGGEGSEMGSLRQLVVELGLTQQVTFGGWVFDKNKFFESIEIYVQPSRAETWGLALREAMAAGKPVIATYCDGPSEYIKNLENGILVGIESPGELADAIQRLISDEELRSQIAANASVGLSPSELFNTFAVELLTFINQILVFDEINWSKLEKK